MPFQFFFSIGIWSPLFHHQDIPNDPHLLAGLANVEVVVEDFNVALYGYLQTSLSLNVPAFVAAFNAIPPPATSRQPFRDVVKGLWRVQKEGLVHVNLSRPIRYLPVLDTEVEEPRPGHWWNFLTTTNPNKHIGWWNLYAGASQSAETQDPAFGHPEPQALDQVYTRTATPGVTPNGRYRTHADGAKGSFLWERSESTNLPIKWEEQDFRIRNLDPAAAVHLMERLMATNLRSARVNEDREPAIAVDLINRRKV